MEPSQFFLSIIGLVHIFDRTVGERNGEWGDSDGEQHAAKGCWGNRTSRLQQEL